MGRESSFGRRHAIPPPGVVSSPFPGVEENAVVDDQEEVVAAVAGDVGDHRLPRFRNLVAALAEGALLKDRPAVARLQLVRRFEPDEIDVIPGGLQKHEVPCGRRCPGRRW